MSNITEKEYLILSELAYLDFTLDDDVFKNLYDLFINDSVAGKKRREELCKDNTGAEVSQKGRIETDSKSYEDVLKKWKVIDVKDNNIIGERNGFYRVTFQNISTNEIVVILQGTGDKEELNEGQKNSSYLK